MTLPSKTSLADQLRAEFGITERAALGRKSSTGMSLCTAGEFRALFYHLGLSRKQFSAHFRIPHGTLHWWLKSLTAKDLYVSKPDVHAKLLPVVQRAGELGLLRPDPRPESGTQPKSAKGSNDAKGPFKPRAEMVRFRCTHCGQDLRKRDVLTDNHGDLYHERSGEGCGPVRTAVTVGQPLKVEIAT